MTTYRVVATLKDGDCVLDKEVFETKEEAETYCGIIQVEDLADEIDETLVCREME